MIFVQNLHTCYSSIKNQQGSKVTRLLKAVQIWNPHFYGLHTLSVYYNESRRPQMTLVRRVAAIGLAHSSSPYIRQTNKSNLETGYAHAPSIIEAFIFKCSTPKNHQCSFSPVIGYQRIRTRAWIRLVASCFSDCVSIPHRWVNIMASALFWMQHSPSTSMDSQCNILPTTE